MPGSHVRFLLKFRLCVKLLHTQAGESFQINFVVHTSLSNQPHEQIEVLSALTCSQIDAECRRIKIFLIQKT